MHYFTLLILYYTDFTVSQLQKSIYCYCKLNIMLVQFQVPNVREIFQDNARLLPFTTMVLRISGRRGKTDRLAAVYCFERA